MRRGLGLFLLVALYVGVTAVDASAHPRIIHIQGGMASVPSVSYGSGNTVLGFSGTFTSAARCTDNRALTVYESSADTGSVYQFFASGATDVTDPFYPTFGNWSVTGSGIHPGYYKFVFARRVAARNARRIIICNAFTYILNISF